MASLSTKPLKGFRDFLPEQCLVRNHIFSIWRDVMRRYGFVEYEGPVLEPTDLYRKKSGEEVVEQLFAFVDKGEREVSLRPELTPTLARMIAGEHRNYKKPMRWFGVGQFFRYERQQVGKGRQREFYQLNTDILGENGPGADAEILAVAVDVMRALRFEPGDIVVRLSDRALWTSFLSGRGLDNDACAQVLQAIDKLEKEPEEALDKRLAPHGLTVDEIRAFMEETDKVEAHFAPLLASLDARGMSDFVEIDLRIVRGLAYYTGTVFEVFDRKHGLRAIAGGGRYDQLISTLTDGKVSMPAVGLGMGDAVLAALIEKTAQPSAAFLEYSSRAVAIDAFVVIASEENRAAAESVAHQVRGAGYSVHFPLSKQKVGKQFQSAEMMQARAAIVVGEEFPELRIKDLENRREETVEHPEALIPMLEEVLNRPPTGDFLV